MFITQIDETYDKILNMLYDIIINKNLLKIFKSNVSFINGFKNMNEHIIDLREVIKNDIDNILNFKNNVEYILDKIIEYLYIYIFLLYGYYENNNDIFINTIYKLIKNNTKLFDSEYVLQLQICHNNLLKVLKYINDKVEDEYVINLLKNINQKLFENKNINHNIIKIIIFKDIYIKEDKKNIYKILENEELNNAETKFIEIIDVEDNDIDYSNLERLFNEKEIRQGLVEEFYNLLISYHNDDLNIEHNINQKINILFERKILIPIVEDFLRYNRENEYYDKEITKINIKERVFKKSETKIKYIITKLNKINNLYEKNENRDEIKSFFYQSHLNRDAIPINDIEEIQIINKIERQELSDINNNEYYDELLNYRIYPYNSFKSLSKDGIYFKSNNVIPCVRYTNIKYLQDKQFINNKNDLLEWRVINADTKVNIVGVLLINHNIVNRISYFECNRLNNLKNVNDIYKNGYNVILHRLQRMILDDKEYNKILYWLFNVNNDKVYKKYFNTITNSSDYIHNLFFDLYEELNNITKKLIKDELIDAKGDSQTLLKICNDIENNLIPLNDKQRNDVYKYIYYYKCNLKEIKYDTNDDKIPGSSKNIIKLPDITFQKKEIPIIKVSKNNDNKYNDEYEKIFENTTCQHYISWNYLNSLKFYEPNKYNQLLYLFIDKYAMKNNNGIYICKSCYETLQLKEFITSWDEENNDILINYNLNTNLENIYEYSKYNKFIKNLEKLIEKITYVSGLKYYSSPSVDIKLKRQSIIRNIIDIVNLQYKLLFNKNINIRVETEKSANMYKFNKDLSTYFLFQIDNELFTYSSKETDKYKKLKLNIIYCYVIYFLLNDLNEVQINFLNYDNIINYMLFEKFGYSLFDNILIRVNNSNNLVLIKNYKLLCFIIYYLTGIIIKYGMWFDETIEYKKMNPNISLHRKIINTFVHVINKLFETNYKEKNNIYQMISGKFYQNIKLIYSIDNINKSILNYYSTLTKNKVEIVGKIIKFNVKKLENIMVQKFNYDDNDTLKTYFDLLNKKNAIKYYFNKYNIIYSRKEILKNYDELYNNSLQKLIKDSINKYSYDGSKRNDKPSENDFNDMLKKDYKTFFKNINDKRLININKIKEHNDKLHMIEINKINKYNKKFNDMNNDNIDIVIDEFIKYIETLIQKNYNLNNVYLKYNVYIINHDYNGYQRNDIFINENDNKLLINREKKLFNQDVYYYLDINTNITMYYSVITNQYIGYKEQGKDIIKITNSNNYLKINYSIKHKLLYLGFNYMYNNIDKKSNITDIVNNLFDMRLMNLKNCINETLHILFRVKNKNDKDDKLSKLYIDKINYLNIYDDNLNRIFNEWNKIQKVLNVDKINNKVIIDKIMFDDDIYISSMSLLKIKNSINKIINYYINNFKKLIDIQTNEYIKINVCYLIIEIINKQFNKYNLFETSKNNIHSKYFMIYISSKSQIKDMITNIYDVINDTDDLTQEALDIIKNNKLDDKEADDALDIDTTMDDNDDGDEDTDILREKED